MHSGRPMVLLDLQRHILIAGIAVVLQWTDKRTEPGHQGASPASWATMLASWLSSLSEATPILAAVWQTLA